MLGIFKSFTDSIDKIFRYLIPGVVLFVFVVCAYPNTWSNYLKDISTGKIMLLVFSAGLVCSVVYRGFLTVLEFLIIFRTNLTAVSLFKNHGLKVGARWAKFVVVRQKIRTTLPELSDYLDIRWSFVHLLTQSSVIFFIFSFIPSWAKMQPVSLAVLIVAVSQHGWMYYGEKKVIKDFLKNKEDYERK
jgi:hypothetical protein